MDRLVRFCAFAALACGTEPSTAFRLQVGSSAASGADGGSPSIEMQTGQVRTLELFVIGAVTGPVSFTATDLPSFAALDGPILTLAPGRPDAGEYQLTLVASDGHSSQTASIRAVVRRSNVAPTIMFSFPMISDDTGERSVICPGSHCTVSGPAQLKFAVCDGDGDGVTVEVEAVPEDTSFSGVATHSVHVAAADARPSPCGTPAVVRLTGLAPERSYKVTYRATDDFGARALMPRSTPDGWMGGDDSGALFEQGPCTTTRCACVPTRDDLGGLCNSNADCCSGICSFLDTTNFLRCR